MRNRAFTLIELMVVVTALLVLVIILLPTLTTHHCGSRQLKDSVQLRGTWQSMAIWAQSNNGFAPLPSMVDLADATVNEGQAAAPELGARKDISRHIMSLLIFNGYLPPEMLVSPAESNPQIRPFETYAYAAPPAAEGDPAKALWDPAFAATPADEIRFGRKPGDSAGFSYAHIPPFGRQKARWSGAASSFNASMPVLANRGPVYAGSAAAGWKPIPGAFGQHSNTNLIHGRRDTWEGNVSFSDGHVDFLAAPDPTTLAFAFSGLRRQSRPDCLFANEHDRTGLQLPANPPAITPKPAPDSGGTYTDPDAGEMTTAYLRPVSRADVLGNKVLGYKVVMTAFVD